MLKSGFFKRIEVSKEEKIRLEEFIKKNGQANKIKIYLEDEKKEILRLECDIEVGFLCWLALSQQIDDILDNNFLDNNYRFKKNKTIISL